MSDPLDRLITEFADVTAKANLTKPSVHRRPGSALARVMAAALVLVVGGAAVVAVLGTRVAQGPATSSHVAVDRSGDYQLTLTTDATQYLPTQAISAVAELAYVGTSPSVEIGSLGPAPIGFGVRQVSGSINAEPSWELQCMQVDLSRDQPLRQPFTKFGGWNDSDPNRDFYAWFFHDPQLHLPTGTWEIYAKVDAGPNGGDCQGQIELQATVTITVLPGSPIPIPSLPTPFPPGVPTPPPPTASPAWLACSAIVNNIPMVLSNDAAVADAFETTAGDLSNYVLRYSDPTGGGGPTSDWRSAPGAITVCWFDGDLMTETPGPPGHDTSAVRVLVAISGGEAELVAIARHDSSLLPTIDPATVQFPTGPTPSPAPPSATPSAGGTVVIPNVDGGWWAPDGQHLLVDEEDGVHILDANGQHDVDTPAYSGSEAAWLDSTKVAVLVRENQTDATGQISFYDLSGALSGHVDGQYQSSLVSQGNDVLAAVGLATDNTLGDTYKVWDNGVLSDWRQGEPLAWSADGTMLAVLMPKLVGLRPGGSMSTLASIVNAGDPSDHGDLVVVDRQGDDVLRIPGLVASTFAPYVFSPDGRYLAACLSNRSDTIDAMRVIDTQTGSITDVAQSCAYEVGWSDEPRLYLSSALGSPIAWTPEEGVTPTSLPDETSVAVAPNGDLVNWSNSGDSAIRVISGGATIVYALDGDVQSAGWDPDGQRITVTSAGALTIITPSAGSPAPSPSASSWAIDAANARFLALVFFNGPTAHGTDAVVDGVNVQSVSLGTDTKTGRPAWIVQVSGTVTEPGGGATKGSTYLSAMVLAVDAQTGEVEILAQG